MGGNHTDQIYSRGEMELEFGGQKKGGEIQIDVAGKYNNVHVIIPLNADTEEEC